MNLAHPPSLLVLALTLLAAPTGCGGALEGATTGTGGHDAGAGTSGTGGATGSGGAATGLRTLDDCGTKFAADVPAFYKKYFRCVDVSMSGGDVVLKIDDLPPHRSPYYAKSDPNWIAFDTQGGTHFQNPNQLSAQSFSVRIPADPVPKGLTIGKTLVDGQGGTSVDEYHPKPGAAPGVSLDGVAMFHGVAAPGDDLAKQAFTFDDYEGHPEPTGAYHYHGASPGPLAALRANGLVKSTKPGAAEVELYAIMCDGALVLGCTELDGTAPDSSDFDAQNGHVRDIAADGTVYFAKRYHTHVCTGKYPDGFAPEIQYYVKCGG